jgi:hypothetical protein
MPIDKEPSTMHVIDTSRPLDTSNLLPKGWPRVVTSSLDCVERLPFTIRVVRDDTDLFNAVRVRHDAYARHVPEFAASLREPEAADFEPGAAVLIAESHLDRTPLGTVRIQTNKFNKLKIQTALDLPGAFGSQLLAEATRLGVAQGSDGHAVKAMLFKAGFLYCRSIGVQSLLVTARRPLDRYYESLMFKDIFQPNEFFPLDYVGNMLHRVMSFSIPNAEKTWAAARHPYYKVLFLTRHPDIKLQPDTEEVDASVAAPMPATAAAQRETASLR